jgi:hypothetical protein
LHLWDVLRPLGRMSRVKPVGHLTNKTALRNPEWMFGDPSEQTETQVVMNLVMGIGQILIGKF